MAYRYDIVGYEFQSGIQVIGEKPDDYLLPVITDLLVHFYNEDDPEDQEHKWIHGTTFDDWESWDLLIRDIADQYSMEVA